MKSWKIHKTCNFSWAEEIEDSLCNVHIQVKKYVPLFFLQFLKHTYDALIVCTYYETQKILTEIKNFLWQTIKKSMEKMLQKIQKQVVKATLLTVLLFWWPQNMTCKTETESFWPRLPRSNIDFQVESLALLACFMQRVDFSIE